MTAPLAVLSSESVDALVRLVDGDGKGIPAWELRGGSLNELDATGLICLKPKGFGKQVVHLLNGKEADAQALAAYNIKRGALLREGNKVFAVSVDTSQLGGPK